MAEVKEKDGIKYVERNGVVFINATPHPIVVFDEAGESVVMEIPKSGVSIRVPEKVVEVKEIAGFKVNKVERDSTAVFTQLEEIEKKFESEGNEIVLIASGVVVEVAGLPSKKFHVVAPDTNNGVVRDENGRIKGVRYFKTV